MAAVRRNHGVCNHGRGGVVAGWGGGWLGRWLGWWGWGMETPVRLISGRGARVVEWASLENWRSIDSQVRILSSLGGLSWRNGGILLRAAIGLGKTEQ